MKKYAERSEAKKNTEKLKEGLKSSILGPQNLGSGGPEPLGPPGSTSEPVVVFCIHKCNIMHQLKPLNQESRTVCNLPSLCCLLFFLLIIIHKYNVFLINVHSHLSIHCHKEIKASGLAKKANYLTLLRRVYIKT